jgi:hypothetical protein
MKTEVDDHRQETLFRIFEKASITAAPGHNPDTFYMSISYPTLEDMNEAYAALAALPRNSA